MNFDERRSEPTREGNHRASGCLEAVCRAATGDPRKGQTSKKGFEACQSGTAEPLMPGYPVSDAVSVA